MGIKDFPEITIESSRIFANGGGLRKALGWDEYMFVSVDGTITAIFKANTQGAVLALLDRLKEEFPMTDRDETAQYPGGELDCGHGYGDLVEGDRGKPLCRKCQQPSAALLGFLSGNPETREPPSEEELAEWKEEFEKSNESFGPSVQNMTYEALALRLIDEVVRLRSDLGEVREEKG